MCELTVWFWRQALSPEEQAARVQRWAGMEDDSKVRAALSDLPLEAGKRVADLRTTLQILKIQRARSCSTCEASGSSSTPIFGASMLQKHF